MKIQDKLTRHLDFWNHKRVDRPLLGYSIGGYYPTSRYPTAALFFKKDEKIIPDTLKPELFIEDYERLYRLSLSVDQDLLWVAEPLLGIPWIEGILGCQIRATEHSLWADSWLEDWSQLPIEMDLDHNPWFQQYIEFTKALVKQSRGRYPVGQSILRGPSDVLFSIRGPSRAILDFLEYPEEVKRGLKLISDIYQKMIRRQQEIVPKFETGYGLGYFYLWAPRPCLWLPEDASAMLSPPIYRDFLLPIDEEIVKSSPYNLFHLHPVSFFILDQLIENPWINCIQINKDAGGLSIGEMVPSFLKVLKKKPLMIWGEFLKEELEELAANLPPNGLAFHLLVSTPEEAGGLMELIRSRTKSVIFR